MDIDPTSYPDLKFFDRFGAIEKSQNRLPHWQQDSATCFLTFRLEDSLPNELLGQFRQERSAWLRVHPTPWSPTIHEHYHQLFSARIDRWLDEAHGSSLLADPALASFVSQTLSFRDGTEYLLHSWVVMPNHVHALMSPAQGQKMSKILAAWKRFSATKIHRSTGASGALWQKDSFDRLIRDWDPFINVARYIRRNPRKLREGSYLLYEAVWLKRLLS